MATMSDLWNLLCVDLMDNSGVLAHDLIVDSTNRSAGTSPSANIHTRAAAALLRSIPKKYQGEINEIVEPGSPLTRQNVADAAAFELFLTANDECSSWSLKEEHAGDRKSVV